MLNVGISQTKFSHIPTKRQYLENVAIHDM
jgi:hypothetical protein